MLRRVSETPPPRETFEDLVKPLLDSLYRTAFRMVEDRLVAEELVQEACLKAYAQFERYEDGTNFKAWIFRILSNLCIDQIRRRAGATFVPIDSLPKSVGATALLAPSANPEATTIGRNVGGVVAKALSSLRPELRVVVMLILVEEMTYAEAAESLGLPVGTVRSRLHRARAELQDKLGRVLGSGPGKAKGPDVSRVVMLFA
ncbi:MAG: sigma-70 family RNA polymerase sigma factor [Pseudomonadota bacterium]